MIKEYRKISTIKAEQFNDTNDKDFFRICDKYKLVQLGSDLHFELPTLEGPMKIRYGDWIATGANGEHWAIRDDIFRKTYVPVEPKGIFYYSNKMKNRDKLVKFFSEKNLHIDSEKLASQVIDLLDEDDWNFL